MKILLVAINAKYIHSNPAVYSLYAYAKKWQEHIEIAQYNINQQTGDILADIYNRAPDLVAISGYIWNMNQVRQLLVDIKSVLPQTDIWLGGPEVSFDAPRLLEEYPELAGVMVGEGESTFAELVECYVNCCGASNEFDICKKSRTDLLDKAVIYSRSNLTDASENKYKRLSQIPGLWIRIPIDTEMLCKSQKEDVETKSADNDAPVGIYEDVNADIDKAAYKAPYVKANEPTIIFTGNRDITDINDIPFIYDDDNWDQFNNRIIYYESSRGCPFRCSYCLSAIDKSVRLRSLDKVFSELQFFFDKKVPQVKFIDRTFNCNKDHAMAIWKYLLEHDNGITNFHFEVAADLLNEDELKLIQKMRPGLIQLEIGVQTTNLVTIKEINRRMNLEKVAENVAKIRSFNNTHQHLDLIVGLPYEDKTSFIKSFNDVHAMKPNQLQLGFLKVLKGSVMEERRNLYDLKYQQTPPYEVFSTKWISYNDVLALKKVEEMVELLYNSGQFSTSLKVLMPQFESAYAFYEAIAGFYEEKGYFVQTPSRNYRYNVLYEFGKSYVNEELLAQALTFDLYLRENCKSRVDFAKDLMPFKVQIRELSGEKERCRQAHIDVFDYCLWENADKLEKSTFVRFDYTNRNPLNSDAEITIIG